MRLFGTAAMGADEQGGSAQFRSQVLFESDKLRAIVRTATIRATSTTTMDVPANTACLWFKRQGTILLRTPSDTRWSILPVGSVSLLRGPANLTLRVARGEQECRILTWALPSTPGLLDDALIDPAKPSDRLSVMTQPVNPLFVTAVDRLNRALNGKRGDVEALLFSVIYESCAYLKTGVSSFGLTPLPIDLAEGIVDLTEAVRKNPEQAWPLKDAADFVGYSPFHFSRVFKASVGYGFHEFVDRCRTEMAVELLRTTDSPIDVIATAAGFGTTQGLRESVKEYLGLVPSELRSDPDPGE
ncbi:MAG: helix-turn-helix transcriptional regulator [Fimbriimonadaceae bacterium]|nr:helix-turn-helix transcriptional regulator [Fimbriimonadaceae bacterium]